MAWMLSKLSHGKKGLKSQFINHGVVKPTHKLIIGVIGYQPLNYAFR